LARDLRAGEGEGGFNAEVGGSPRGRDRLQDGGRKCLSPEFPLKK